MTQQEIEERIQSFLKIRLQEKKTINSMMKMELQSYDVEQRTIKLSFPIEAWQLNPAGHMHGGLICTALDITMGCASYVFSKAIFTPTIQMSVNFVNGITSKDRLLITGICDHSGSRMMQVRAIATIQEGTITAATAHGSYAVNK